MEIRHRLDATIVMILKQNINICTPVTALPPKLPGGPPGQIGAIVINIAILVLQLEKGQGQEVAKMELWVNWDVPVQIRPF